MITTRSSGAKIGDHTHRGSGVTLAQIAKDFGISMASLNLWLQKARIADGEQPGVTSEQAAETRDLRRKVRLLEQENEVLRRAAAYLGQAEPAKKMMFPLVRELAVDGIPVTVTCRVLKLCRAHYYRCLLYTSPSPRDRQKSRMPSSA